MKIIKHGDLKLRYFICNNCGCEFIADRSEYQTAASGDNFFVSCPECYTQFSQYAPLHKEDYNETSI